MALGVIGPEVDGVTPALASAHDDPTREVRKAAIEALGPWSGAREEATRALVGFFGDDDAGLRRMACGSCGADIMGNLAGPGGRMALPEVAALLSGDPSNQVRRAAVRTIIRNDLSDPAARAALVAALGDDWSEVRTLAAIALGLVGPPAADPGTVTALAARLRDRQANVVVAAAGALEAMGPRAAEAGPALQEALQRPEPEVRPAVEAAIRAAGE